MKKHRIFWAQRLNILEKYELMRHHNKHLLVRRARIGDPVVIFNDLGGEYHGIIKDIIQKKFYILIDKFVNQNRLPKLKISIAIPVISYDKCDLMVQKLTELGVSEIIFYHCRYSKPILTSEEWSKKYSHWHNIAISASEQSERNLLPKILHKHSLVECISDNTYYANLNIDNPYQKIMPFSNISECILIVGPEGGFHTDENLILLQKARMLSLGATILRTETAAIVSTFQLLQLHCHN